MTLPYSREQYVVSTAAKIFAASFAISDDDGGPCFPEQALRQAQALAAEVEAGGYRFRAPGPHRPQREAGQ
jgi:hypothetical protein